MCAAWRRRREFAHRAGSWTATFPLMGGKVSGLNLHSRLTGVVHLAWSPENTSVEPCPPGSLRRVFSCPGRGRILCVLGRGRSAREIDGSNPFRSASYKSLFSFSNFGHG